MSPLFLAAALQGGPEGYGAALLRMLAALLVVCVVAYLALRYGLRWLLPRRRGSSLLEVIEHCPLGGGKGLWIVRVEGRRLLLGGAEGGLSMLKELGEEESEGALRDGSEFAAVLARGATRSKDEGPAE